MSAAARAARVGAYEQRRPPGCWRPAEVQLARRIAAVAPSTLPASVKAAARAALGSLLGRGREPPTVPLQRAPPWWDQCLGWADHKIVWTPQVGWVPAQVYADLADTLDAD